MAFSSVLREQIRRSAKFVADILKSNGIAGIEGERTERPKQFELAINLETARGAGLDVPREFFDRADRVVLTYSSDECPPTKP